MHALKIGYGEMYKHSLVCGVVQCSTDAADLTGDTALWLHGVIVCCGHRLLT